MVLHLCLIFLGILQTAIPPPGNDCPGDTYDSDDACPDGKRDDGDAPPMTAMATPMGPVMAAAMATPMGPVMAAKPAQVTTLVTMPTKVATVVAAMPTQAVIVVVAISTKAATGRVVMPTQVQNVVVIMPIQPTTVAAVAAKVPTTAAAMPAHGETAAAVMPSQAPDATVIPFRTTAVIPFRAITLPVAMKMSIHDNLFSESYGDDACMIIGRCDGSSVLFLDSNGCST